jgi:Tfp pilus assembly protein PilZ
VSKRLGRREMRRFDRRRAIFPVSVRTAGAKTEGSIHLDSADLSEGGAFLRSELLFEIGDTLELEIPLPSGQPIKAMGRVVRVSQSGEPDSTPGMGIEFVQLSLADRRTLAAALAAAGVSAGSKPVSGKRQPPT